MTSTAKPRRLGAYSPERLKRAVRLGIKSVWNHRLRSLLTVLGIVFGVCSVIAMLAIGEGLSYEAQQQIRRLGSNNIILKSVKPPEDQSNTAQRSWSLDYGLTYDDVSRIQATVPNIEVVVPTRIIRRDVWNVGGKVDCDVTATVPWYPASAGLEIERGRFFSAQEFDERANVCVLGAGVAERIFPLDDYMGRTVRVAETSFRVIGALKAIGASSASAVSEDSAGEKKEESAPAPGVAPKAEGAQFQVYIPLTTAKARFGELIAQRRSGSFSAERVELHEVTVKVADLAQVVEISEVISDLLERHHKKRDFQMIVPLELLRQAERTKRIFSVVLGAIAAISLLVGGIGIMNIMLASVTERTREIGIRRALGARRSDIILQFLIETVLLSATGGVIGVALGLAIPFMISYFAQMKTIVTLWSPIIAFTISALVGIVFGIYPALRAADMDPVEALRHE